MRQIKCKLSVEKVQEIFRVKDNELRDFYILFSIATADYPDEFFEFKDMDEKAMDEMKNNILSAAPMYIFKTMSELVDIVTDLITTEYNHLYPRYFWIKVYPLKKLLRDATKQDMMIKILNLNVEVLYGDQKFYVLMNKTN